MKFVASHPLDARDYPTKLEVNEYDSGTLLLFTLRPDSHEFRDSIILTESEAAKLCEYLDSYLRREAY